MKNHLILTSVHLSEIKPKALLVTMSMHLRHEGGIFLEIQPEIMIKERGLLEKLSWDSVENLWILEETGKG